jgi:acetyltransferase
MVGLGGIYAEILNDVAFGLNPLTKTDVKLMLAKLKSVQILAGARGKKSLDQEALIQSILRLAQLVKDWPEIKEIDINPLVVKEQGVVALDGRIIID